jgi:hypothetical protein
MATTAPHKMVSVIHITDYAKWLASFNGFEARESQGGLRNPQILRGVTDPNFVAILFDVDDVAKARAFMQAHYCELQPKVGALWVRRLSSSRKTSEGPN